ncbi:MAG: alanine racemase [Burkholderiaceae bacterium]|nr:MAG: alanine racemase [Burkholderiaceae bacterium]
MPRPILAEISHAALAHNLEVARRARPGQKLWAVIKARAYGHGIAHVLPGLQATDGFAVLDIVEAVAVRESGWRGPVLLLEGVFEAADLEQVHALKLDLVVHHEEQVRLLEQEAKSSASGNGTLSIYLKMNSGMNRLGFAPRKYRAAHERLQALPAVGSITHMTHFANADAEMMSSLSMRQQLQVFEQTIAGVPGPRSVCNSAAILNSEAVNSDWLRPGIMLYGSSPFAHRSADALGLKPVMTLRSEIIGVQNLQPGDTVGYGSIYRAEQDMRIGIVACGYADGYPRHAPGDNRQGTPVLVDGQRTRMVGRVSMDMIAVDLTGLPNANVGSAVTLWGQGLSVDEVAHAAGTIGYELLCALSPRVPVSIVA